MFIGDFIINVLTNYSVLFFINLILAFSIIFIERKNPSATLAWIMLLFMIPGVGILLYIILSQNIARQKVAKFFDYEQKLIRDTLKDQIEIINNGKFIFTKKSAEIWKDMIHLGNMSDAYFSQDNQVEVFTDGNELFHSLITDIQGAKNYINVLFFIIKNDELGNKFINALTEKAADGVEVRLLIDAMGSRKITKEVLEPFKNAGGKYAYFFPSRMKINLKLNYRNHRKIVVIDGKTGYTGGFNVGDAYLGKSRKFSYWRDTHLKLTGNCVYDLDIRFLLDWRFASKELIDIFEMSAAYNNPNTVYEGRSGIQIISSGPDSRREEIKYGYLKLISSAKDSIFMQTPYFVPDQSIIEALKGACLSGIDVRIMIPCMPDHMFVYWATYSYIGELLQYGAKVYIYEKGFLHAKTICADSEIASIGSANFDIRSFKLNFETNAFIYDSDVVKHLEEIFEEDMLFCTQLTPELYAKRSLLIKFKEPISRLLSEIL